jgi:hypothetical protein
MKISFKGEAAATSLRLTRRRLMQLAAAGGAWSILPPGANAAPVRGGNLIFGLMAEPDVLTSAITSSGPVQYVSTKIFDAATAAGDGLERVG